MENTHTFGNETPSIIGYAQANFETLIVDKNIYIDRTGYIRAIENHSNRNLLFVRPRRFGKSLWVSILHYYYGVQHKDKFETLFGHLAIGKNPTPLRNSYLILTFKFTKVDDEKDKSILSGFRQNVLTGITDCMKAYPSYFSATEIAEMDTIEVPAHLIQKFFSLYKGKNIPHKLYLLIDEYDQFANELIEHDTENFKAIIAKLGFVPKFYEMIKNAAYEGIVNRFFATGVSPLTVDALTSGFNITSSLALDIDFHDLMGFKQAEVVYILQKIGVSEAEMSSILADLKDWYDGYLFNDRAEEPLYNSDMVMYFASHYEKRKEYPRKMLDANIATDYFKVKKIFNIQQREQEFIPVLKQLTTEGELRAKITDFFNLERAFYENDLISLLYYMGWITIKSYEEGLYNFQMPNQVIKELYYNYFVDIIEQETGLNRTVEKIEAALSELARNNNPHPFLDIIKVLLEQDLSFRDAQGFDEKHVKMLLIPYLSLSASHYVQSEPEWQNGYPDILFLKRPNIETRYNFIIELKYIKQTDRHKRVNPKDKTSEKLLAKVQREARTQLENYLKTDNAKRTKNLKAWVLVLVGREWKIVEEITVE